MLRDAVDGSDAATQVSIDDGAHIAVAKANVVQIPADFLDVDVALEGNPAATEELALGLRVRNRDSQISRELLAHLGKGVNEGNRMKEKSGFLGQIRTPSMSKILDANQKPKHNQ